MQNRFLVFTVAALLAVAPALADTTSNSSTMTVNPTNSLSVNPTTNQQATTANVSTQINNQNLGANSYGGGVTCQSAQIAFGGYGARQSSNVGLTNSNAGVSVEYLAPVGNNGGKACAAIAQEMLRARKLDNSFTTVEKCADFARSGVVLDPVIYPELSHACSGIRVTSAPHQANPALTSNMNAAAPVTVALVSKAAAPSHALHMSDFSPEHNPYLRRIALHRLQRLTLLKENQPRSVTAHQRHVVAARIRHEDVQLRAIIAEVDLENAFLRRLLKDKSWHAHRNLRERILSYNANAH